MGVETYNNRGLAEALRSQCVAPQSMAQVDIVFHFNSHGLVCCYLIYLINQ